MLPKIQQRVGINLILYKMKNYKKVKLVAKNAPSGSYAAGCPENDRGSGKMNNLLFCGMKGGCVNCERTR